MSKQFCEFCPRELHVKCECGKLVKQTNVNNGTKLTKKEKRDKQNGN